MSKNPDNRLTHFDIPSDDYSSQQSSQGSVGTVAQELFAKPPAELSTRRLKRKADLPAIPEQSTARPPQPRDLAIPSVSNSKKRAVTDTGVCYASPWDSFEKIYECDLAGTVQVVTRKSERHGVYSLRQFSGHNLDELLHKLRFTHHENTASAVECFVTTDGIFAISDFAPLTLEHVVACQAYPNVKQLNAILTQVLNGLAYLVSQDLRHTSLGCSDILMNTNGVVKIGCLEKCVLRDQNESHKAELVSVGNITMELLQKYVKNEGRVGIDKLDRWSSDSVAVSFLSATTSANSIKTLMEHHLISKMHFCKEELIGLAWFALHSTRTFWSYVPPAKEKRLAS